MKTEDTTFYEKLQTRKGLDLRDRRGLVHDLAFVLLGIIIGLLRKRDGCLSSIHRSMVNKNKAICESLGIDLQVVVSRSHLPIILKKVSLIEFEALLFESYGIELSKEEKDWFAGDGKELKGSILSGNKRGEVIVQLVRHSDREVLGQRYYSGNKESEKPCLQKLVEETNAMNQKITADALHLNPKFTQMISEAGGIFVIGLKLNQKHLYEDMEHCPNYLKPVNKEIGIEKGHGRLEKRIYTHYDISEEYFDKRWEKTAFKSLIRVERIIEETKSGKKYASMDYYISNGEYSENEDFFTAIRKHWSVEVNNHIRDVTMQEDKFRAKNIDITKIMAGFRTLVIKILSKCKADNLRAQLDFFQDDFNALLAFLAKIKFL